MALPLLCACERPLSEQECGELLERYVDLLLDSDRKDVTAQERIKLKIEARAKAGRDPAFGECSERVSRGQFTCAVSAEGVDRFEQCMLF